LALGLDPDNSVFFRQSGIPEIPECAWMLACVTSKGLMNRAHAYKAAVDKNLEAERDPDDGINMGLYNYPVLMAADILLYGSDVVPVGLDQKQHIEITRDIAENFNRTYGKTLKLPEGLFAEDLQDVPGIDGRKMSKSYGNTIPIFADENTIRKQVMRIVTDSRTPEEPKNPDGDNLFQIFRLFATPERTEEVRQHYLAGGLGYGTLKQELSDTILAYFDDARQKFNDYMQDTTALDAILERGAEKARDIAIPVLKRMRKAVGIDR
jgi:tryptophanyl-tRNA synthetase